MNQAWKKIQPKNTFSVRQGQLVSDIDKKVLSYLYQPILGVVAFSMYHVFLTMIQEETYESSEMFHADLFNQMDIDLPAFYQGRSRLEAIGLLRVFEKEEQQGKSFLYLLQRPLSYQEFLHDDVMSLLLLDKVGERRFQRVVAEFVMPKVEETDFQETTQKFMDVYRFNEERLVSAPSDLLDAKRMIQSDVTASVEIQSETFDWDYFLSLLASMRLSESYLNQVAKEPLLLLHKLYGLNEFEMKEAVVPFIDYQKNELELTKFKQSMVRQHHNQSVPKEKVAISTSGNSEAIRKNGLKKQSLSDGEIGVIMASESRAPLLFLQDIKKQKNGFVSNQERWAVENLVSQSGLPDSVINILIHYVLVVRGQATFAASLANTIANDWAQAGIKSPEAAIEKVKSLITKKQTTTKQTTGKRQSYQRNVRTETLPDWVDKKIEETPVSAADSEKIAEQLRQLRKNRKEGE